MIIATFFTISFIALLIDHHNRNKQLEQLLYELDKEDVIKGE